MTTRQIRLALRAYGVGGPGQHNLWKDPRVPRDASIDIDWYIAQARAAEHAAFDALFIVDSQFIDATYTIADWFAARAFDGLNLGFRTHEDLERFVGDVVPLLRERGLFRTEYEADTLRGNLGLPIPANRWAAA